MLHILWMLLKIIGIILIVILALLVLAVNIAMFVPLRYQGEASVSGSVDSIKIKVKFSWFLHLFSGYLNYENKQADWQVRVLWRKINEDKPSEEPVEEETEKRGQTEISSGTKAENTVSQKQETAVEKKDIVENKEKTQEKRKKKKKEKQSIFQKIKYTIQNICDKIKLLMKKKEKLKSFIANEVSQSAWNRLIQELFRLLKFLRPKKLVMNLHFGLEDPALTGKILAALSMLYPFFAEHINITPDFERTVLEGNLYIKGTARGMHLFIVAWNLFFEKDIRTTYKEIQQWKS